MENQDIVNAMCVEKNRLHGFARVFWDTMEQPERDLVELLLSEIPDKNTIAWEMWKAALVQVFAESSKERIAFMVEQLHNEELQQ